MFLLRTLRVLVLHSFSFSVVFLFALFLELGHALKKIAMTDKSGANISFWFIIPVSQMAEGQRHS